MNKFKPELIKTKNQGRCKCGLCDEYIWDVDRIAVYINHRGSLKRLQNLHTNCWNKLCDMLKEVTDK